MIEDIQEILDELEFSKAESSCVSIYSRTRNYGGPEEGGWWYDRNHLEYYKQCSCEEEAQAVKEVFEKKVEERNQQYQAERHKYYESMPDGPDPYYDTEGYIPTGWNDGEEFLVVIEDQPGQWDNSNEPRPHYE